MWPIWRPRVEQQVAERSTTFGPGLWRSRYMSDDQTTELGRAIDTLRDRRAVLRGAAVAGLAGVGLPLLAACGDDGDSSGAASDPTSPPSSAPSSAPTTGTSSAPTTGGGGAVLGPVSDVPVGGGKVFTDAKIV